MDSFLQYTRKDVAKYDSTIGVSSHNVLIQDQQNKPSLNETPPDECPILDDCHVSNLDEKKVFDKIASESLCLNNVNNKFKSITHFVFMGK